MEWVRRCDRVSGREEEREGEKEKETISGNKEYRDRGKKTKG